MKIRKHRLSLAVGILATVIGGLFSLFLAFRSRLTAVPEVVNDIISKGAVYAGIGSGELSLFPLSVIVFITGLLILLFRRKKRFSMYLSVPFIAIIYFTVMVFFHLTDGNENPAFIVSLIDAEKAWLLIVCAVLEILLFLILMTVSGKADSRIFEKEIKRNKRIMLQEERKEAEAEDDIASESEEETPRSEEDAKNDKRYMKMKERMDRKTAKKEARLAAKDEKKFRKLQDKEERKARKEAEAAAAKEAKIARKQAKKDNKEVPADDDESVFLTKGAPAEKPRYIDPSERVDIPEVGELPHMKRLRTPDDSVRTTQKKEVPSFEMPLQSDVFSQIKDEMEREESDEHEHEADDHISYDFNNPSSFSKGGMLEATLETLQELNKSGNTGKKRNTSPIIGFDNTKEEKSARKNNSSFAPSNLSPEHPRYKLFESLAQQKNVSSFPSKTFEAELPDEEPVKAEAFIKSEQPAEKKIPGMSGFMKSEESPVQEAPAKPVVEPFTAEEDEGPDPFEEIQRQEAEKKALRQAAAKKKAENVESVVLDEEERDVPNQENELMLSVGIGGLQSNDLGYAGISQRSKKKYMAPPANILVDYPKSSSEIDDFTKRQGEIILETFNDFHVNVSLDEIIKGPTVTMYQLKLGEGVMVQKVKQREDELSYNLGGVRIRILAPVPGRQAVGIEVPNKHRAIIGFKDMLHEFKRSEDSEKLRVPMILGRTITGEPVTIDVAKMPHMLIAGTTGSGKSVCINSFICTLIYTRSPQDVRLIMVDPKVVELTVYNDIPHLLTPVITEPKKVVKALGWLCDEMERRYQMISKFGVRNIEGLNAKIRNENIPAEKLPYIVLIMDEFADLMSTVGKDIETYVARLAAKARAAGIHLILATQRPSADVITGTIKNNFPARIAFAVSSGTNSRIILDEGGAENLLGRGDMLLMEPSTMGFQRIQGAFLSDDEVYSIVGFAKKHGSPDYLSEDIFEEPEVNTEESDDGPVSDEDSDEVLYERAKQIVYERKCASASFLQRRMKIGYNRAARLIEMMEENGIIGPQNGSKPREILKYE